MFSFIVFVSMSHYGIRLLRMPQKHLSHYANPDWLVITTSASGGVTSSLSSLRYSAASLKISTSSRFTRQEGLSGETSHSYYSENRGYASNLKFSFIVFVSMSHYGIWKLPYCQTCLSRSTTSTHRTALCFKWAQHSVLNASGPEQRRPADKVDKGER